MTTITEPGKFEGEPVWTPIFWDQVLDGWAEVELYVDGDLISFIEITEEDRRRWPGLPTGRNYIALWENVQGFVHTRHMTREEMEKLKGELGE